MSAKGGQSASSESEGRVQVGDQGQGVQEQGESSPARTSDQSVPVETAPIVDQACHRFHEAYERHAAANNWETNPLLRAWEFEQLPYPYQDSMRAAMQEVLDWLHPTPSA